MTQDRWVATYGQASANRKEVTYALALVEFVPWEDAEHRLQQWITDWGRSQDSQGSELDMERFLAEAVRTAPPKPECEWSLVVDDVHGEPWRFELENDGPTS